MGISAEGDFEFREQLINDYGVAAILFFRMYCDGQDDKLIRFCFAKTDDVLYKTGQRLELL